jgi:hypothetical protein
MPTDSTINAQPFNDVEGIDLKYRIFPVYPG